MSVPLDEAEIATWQIAAQQPDEDAASQAVYVLGRRVPAERMEAVLSQLPSRLHAVFARAAAGRAPALQRPTLPAEFTDFTQLWRAEPGVGAWIGRVHATVPTVTDAVLRRHLASGRTDDQIVGARMLASPSASVPVDLIAGLPPAASTIAFRAVAYLTNELRRPPPPGRWREWIASTSVRLRSNPRAWAGPWLTLLDAAPRTDPDTRAALLTELAVVREVAVGEASVDAAFRCANARAQDAISGTMTATPACANGEHRWRSLVAQAQAAVALPTVPERLAVLQRIQREAGADARVLEALAEALGELPPTTARPMLTQLASSRDPGVLAVLLEGMALHVQHARALPATVRRDLIQSPFSLDEASSLEARLQAIRLARLTGDTVPESRSATRAIQQALQPDAAVPSPNTSDNAPVEEGDLVINTTAGRIVVRLDPAAAPQAVHLVVEAARGERYDNTTFHRVVPSFVAQGGDPRGDGYGGTTTITPTELSGRRFVRGAVGIALAGLDTGGMQFFIVTADAPHLDANYPYIGRVVEGIETADELMVGDVIRRVEFVAR